MTPLLALLAAAAAVLPLSWSKTTRDAEVSLTLPAAVRSVPVLYGRLWRGETKALERFVADAAKGRASEPAEMRRNGRWEDKVTYSLALRTARLISLRREEFADTHGAHPNTALGGIVFDLQTNTRLKATDLLVDGADLAPLNRALCDAARAAKRERAEGQWSETDDPNFACPTWKGVPGPDGKLLAPQEPVQVALAPGTEPGKAGGLVFVYSPYDIGAYVEGGYDVVAPQAVFRAALKPEYAAEFGGRPIVRNARP
jgi:hypothetical protein